MCTPAKACRPFPALDDSILPSMAACIVQCFQNSADLSAGAISAALCCLVCFSILRSTCLHGVDWLCCKVLLINRSGGDYIYYLMRCKPWWAIEFCCVKGTATVRPQPGHCKQFSMHVTGERREQVLKQSCLQATSCN